MEFGIFAYFPINKLNSIEMIMNQSTFTSTICCSQYEYAVRSENENALFILQVTGGGLG
jgi:hypothetical protein